MLWLPLLYVSAAVRCNYLTTLKRLIPDDYMLRCTLCNDVDYKDVVAANRYSITIVKFIFLFDLYHNGSGANDP